MIFCNITAKERINTDIEYTYISFLSRNSNHNLYKSLFIVVVYHPVEKRDPVNSWLSDNFSGKYMNSFTSKYLDSHLRGNDKKGDGMVNRTLK